MDRREGILTMVSTPQAALKHYPFARTHPLLPPPEIADIREEEPISQVTLWDGSTAWLATRYEDVRAILVNPAVTSDTLRPGFPQASATAAQFRSGQRVFVRMDAPKHDEHRLMLTADFMVKRVREYRPYLDQMIVDIFDEMEQAGGPVDLVRALALPVPSRVITKLLDLPDADSEFFLDRVETAMSLDVTPEQSRQAGADTLAYFAKTIEDRWDNDEQDLISRLVRTRVKTGELTAEELQHMLHLLLVGGFDTTANMIALGTLTFLQNPEQIAKLRAEPDLVANAVEELLRYLSVAHHVAYRQAREPFVFEGREIAENDGIIAPVMAANHDPEVFVDPDRFDISRDARGHLAFGYGIHQCLGQALARVELQAVFSLMFQRFPNLRLAVPFENLNFRNSIIYGVGELPVTW
jgi:cytochrome P450